MKKLTLFICALAVVVAQIQAAQVEAEGRSAGHQKAAREQALADALREAVRKGTGGCEKHGIDFDEAQVLSLDDDRVEFPARSETEERVP